MIHKAILAIAGLTILVLATLTLDVATARAAPSVTVDAPSPATGTITVTAKGTKTKLAGLEVYVDDELKKTCTGTPCRYKWNTRGSTNGVHGVSAIRRDRSGSSMESAPVSIVVQNVDASAPSVSLSVPTSVTGTVTVSASASDPSGISSLAVYLDGSPIQTLAADAVAFSWDSTGVTNGSHTFQARATDTAGNTGQSASKSVTVSNTVSSPPDGGLTLTLVGDPATGPYTVKATVPLNATRVMFGVDGQYFLTDVAPPFDLFRTGDPDSVSPTLGYGGHTIVAEAQNASGTPLATGTLQLWEGSAPVSPSLSPIFPSNNIWNTPVDTAPVHPLNAQWMDYINGHSGHNFHPDFGTTYLGRYNGIPLNVIRGNSVPKVAVTLTSYASESDPIPAGGLPIPTNVLIEGDPGPFDAGADNHCLVLDTDTHTLHEFYGMQRNANGSYTAKHHSRWDYTSNALRRDEWTSSDAAGLPVAPLLVRYDEVLAAAGSGGTVPHAFRFTLDLTWQPHLWPARHDAPTGGPLNPPMGMRVRMKAGYDISGYSPTNQAILRTLKKYGMILADNGGDWYVQGVPDARWNDDDLHVLVQIIPHDAFEVVDVSGWMVSPDSGEARPD